MMGRIGRGRDRGKELPVRLDDKKAKGRDPMWGSILRLAVYGMTIGNTALFAAFYPVLAGVFVPTWYTANFLRWFPAWPF